jgi:cation diffusion facilitator family transporter
MSRSPLKQSCGRNIQECIACEKKAGWNAVYANLALALFKAFIGFVSGSKAIMGDALFSFKDFIASLVVVIGIKVSGKPADDQHPYGHGKIEFVALFLISIGLLVSTVFLFIHSVKGIWLCFNGAGGSAPKLIAFWAALISVVANYKLSEYLLCVGDKLKSPSMLANAKHNHSDAVSSIMVAVAVLGAHFGGMVFLDPLVALIEAVCLFGMSIDMFKDSLKGLFDYAVHPEAVDRIESVARLVPGVRKVTKVIARQVGHGVWVDMTIKVDSSLSHQDGYIIGQHVRESIQAALGENTTVNIVIEPYLP